MGRAGKNESKLEKLAQRLRAAFKPMVGHRTWVRCASSGNFELRKSLLEEEILLFLKQSGRKEISVWPPLIFCINFLVRSCGFGAMGIWFRIANYKVLDPFEGYIG
ncbi:hypothetical protein CASFOL_011489 [Castilleja foliolosa]|uniref:Uncharacterized protein n=1 Tax=Castilleja foliolosa TaxID=1961234 RepID=A0ABD3DZI1_9LAMI